MIRNNNAQLYGGHLFWEPMVSAIERFHCISYPHMIPICDQNITIICSAVLGILVFHPSDAIKRLFKKYVIGLGGREVKQNSDNVWQGGEGGQTKEWSHTTSKKYRFNNRIRITLKVVITPFHLPFNVAFHVDNKVWVENMHILANMRSKLCIKGRLIIRSKFVTIWVVTRGEGVKANGGKVWQGGGRSKIGGGRPVTYFVNDP